MTFEVNLDSYPLLEDKVLTYPNTDINTLQQNFVGGGDLTNARLKVLSGDQDRFIKGNYVQARNGFG